MVSPVLVIGWMNLHFDNHLGSMKAHDIEMDNGLSVSLDNPEAKELGPEQAWPR